MIQEKEKWAFIVNPIAGNYSAKKVVPKLEEEISKRNIDSKIVYTESPGHAVDLALNLIEEGFNNIIAVGGDGTSNEVTKAIINNSNVTYGLVPCGTGNDYNNVLGFPDRFEQEHWDIFFEKNTINADVGSCNGKTFVLGMGLGFDAQVASKNYVEPGKTKLGGKGKYLKNILQTIFFYKEKKMTTVSQNNKVQDCFIHTIGIGRRFGGGFYLTPKAIANDGLFDVCMIEKLTIRQRLKILQMVAKGTHLNEPQINYYNIENIELKFDEEVPYHLDGELFFTNNFDIKMLPGALNVIYNPNGNHYFNGKN